MNQKVMFGSESSEWETPDDLFKQLDREFHFTLDAAASDSNYRCEQYITKAGNGLEHSWDTDGAVWVNPPYGKGVEKWIQRAYDQCIANALTVVMLLPARTDTKWFHKYAGLKHVEIRFLKGRLKFKGAPAPAPFPSLLLIFRPGGKYEFWRA